jgi:hypothetical protein
MCIIFLQHKNVKINFMFTVPTRITIEFTKIPS